MQDDRLRPEIEDIVITHKVQRVISQLKSLFTVIILIVLFVGGWVFRVESHAQTDEIERAGMNADIVALKSELSEIKKVLLNVNLSTARIEGQLSEMKRRK